MPLDPMTVEPTPVTGDNFAYNTIKYMDVPKGYRLKDLALTQDSFFKADLTKQELWNMLIPVADRHYAEWEIVGDTLRDFFDGLQRQFDENLDTFERLLEVYHDDIAKPILGRTETTVYGTPDSPMQTVQTHEDTEVRRTDSGHIDVPIDGSDENPTYKDTAKSKVESGTVKDTSVQSGTVTTTMSDIGVRPNYESLNGFLDNNRTAYQVFIGIFKPCFTLHRTMTW